LKKGYGDMIGRVVCCLLISIGMSMLAACGSAAIDAPATATPERVRPTERARPTSVPSYADLPQGRTPEGYPYLGAADAPVTLVMFSDFL
jgi:hypothetical protein